MESTFFIRFGFPLFGDRTGDIESLDPGEGDGTDKPSSGCLDTELPLLLKETMFDAGSLGAGVTSVVLDMITGLHLSKLSSDAGLTDLSFSTADESLSVSTLSPLAAPDSHSSAELSGLPSIF
jgi:hypothetical protein